ncbi:unnamed protein product [Gongylonema pulchrum]|uniref:Uncharacterized protein n=1 Tax=Gongylonema pulchrum TaxID=637853 RepID=A0A183DAM7_9BILA|nr:unnamed protein product [Gongylonema pulchrum]
MSMTSYSTCPEPSTLGHAVMRRYPVYSTQPTDEMKLNRQDAQDEGGNISGNSGFDSVE